MSDRREFLKMIVATAAVMPVQPTLGAQGSPKPAAGTIHKSTLISMLPRGLSYSERFTLAREAGFEAIEMQTISKDDEAASRASVKRSEYDRPLGSIEISVDL